MFLVRTVSPDILLFLHRSFQFHNISTLPPHTLHFFPLSVSHGIASMCFSFHHTVLYLYNYIEALLILIWSSLIWSSLILLSLNRISLIRLSLNRLSLILSLFECISFPCHNSTYVLCFKVGNIRLSLSVLVHPLTLYLYSHFTSCILFSSTCSHFLFPSLFSLFNYLSTLPQYTDYDCLPHSPVSDHMMPAFY